jgi:glutaredoxin-related protein
VRALLHAPMSDVQQRIDELVKGNRVVLFMKGTAQFPMCGFSGRAIQVLKACGVNDLKTFNVLEDEETSARASRTTPSGPPSRSSTSTASSSAARTS